MSDSTAATFSYSGDIVDAQGKPVPDVEVTATHHHEPRGLSYIDVVRSDARGHFVIDRARARSGRYAADVKEGVIRLAFSHPDHAFARLEDLRTFTRDAATHLQVVLGEGRSLQGQLVDEARLPVAGALVEITFGDDYEQRRGTTTDANGRFAFRGLPNQDGVLHALTVDTAEPALSARAAVEATQTDLGTIAATPITLPPDAALHELFGMKLVDVDDSLRAAFHLSPPSGVLILDPGSRRYQWDFQRGDEFFLVGDKRIKNFAEFAGELLRLRQSSDAESPSQPVLGNRVRIAWAFRRPEFAGTNTQYLELSDADVAELTAATVG